MAAGPQVNSDAKFLSRVNALPIVTAAVDQLAEIYQYTKTYNPYLQYTLETAEAGVKLAALKALPIVNSLDKPIGAIDSLACAQLEKLEKTYPIVAKPTDEIVAESKKVYEATLKPHVDKVTSVSQNIADKTAAAQQYAVDTASEVKQTTVEKVEAAKKYTVDSVAAVKEYSANKVQDAKSYAYDKASATATYGKGKLDAALETPGGQAVMSRVEQALGKTAQYVDYYIPDTNDVRESGISATEGEGLKPTDQTYDKLATISDKVKRRMYAKTLRELQYVKERSKETINRLNFTVDLIEYAKKNLDEAKTKATNAKDKFADMWNEIKKERKLEEEGAEAASDAQSGGTLEVRAIATARHLISQLLQGFSTMIITFTVLPLPLQNKINDAKTFTESMYSNLVTAKKLEDIPSSLIAETRAQVAQLEETVTTYALFIRDNYFGSWLGAKTVSEMEQETNEAIEEKENCVQGDRQKSE